jgi:signal transduction histidine kinase
VNQALQEARNRAAHRRAEEQLKESHQQLRALSVYLQSVREEERTRIAREVHDGLGQALTSCKLDLSLIASKLPSARSELRERAKALSEHIDSTIAMVRRIATELRPGVLDHLGLMAALEWQAADFQNRTGIRCRVVSNVGRPLLDPDLSTAFFRIFQETLTNVIRHAGATEVTVRLREGDDHIMLEVKDNGRGITREELTNPKSLGLLGMRERAELLGGMLRIQPITGGGGTRVTVTIPYRPPPANPRNEHEDTASRRPCRSPKRPQANPRRRVQAGHFR